MSEQINLKQIKALNQVITDVMDIVGGFVTVPNPYRLQIWYPVITDYVRSQRINTDWCETAVIDKLGVRFYPPKGRMEYDWHHNGDYHNLYTIAGMIDPGVAWLGLLDDYKMIKLSTLRQADVDKVIQEFSCNRLWPEAVF